MIEPSESIETPDAQIQAVTAANPVNGIDPAHGADGLNSVSRGVFEQTADAKGVELAVLRQVPMTVQVEVGRTVMTLGEILDELEVGSNIRLDRHAGDPVEVYVNGALFARAEVIVVQDQIGARIIELVAPGQAVRPSGLV